MRVEVLSGEMALGAFYDDVWTRQFPSAMCRFCSTFLLLASEMPWFI